ncbi:MULTISPECIES: site-specific integrase [Hyphomicrobiales]|uniref:Tyrosine-type recombinase/integrase n=2 Tax=Bosea TaxID=85413 RepID=A0ABW0J0H9_9HYPH|nr:MULTISPECIES: site-specific integrase [Hyphomicrobiales]MCO5079721.1 site-specific integrase [Chelatococcus sp.]MCO5153776.1 site-specific integrase [Shinella sp.]MCP9630052.1 site-specific integrase [Rhodopseudomonas palustris]
MNTAPGALDTAERAGLIDDMPFILMDDGSYDLDLNRFFRACPAMGARSPNTWRSYARDILVWARFLHERRGGKTVWQADRHDVLAFHRARRLSDAAYRISASSWNRCVAALDKLYRWAVEEEIITTSPFGYGVALRRASGRRAMVAVTTNRARERAARRHDTRYIDLGRYLLFRDVGLRGRLPDGSEDPAWRGRNGERNALFAELLVTTGLRLTEAGSLLLTELPRLTEAGSRSAPFDLAGPIAKGGRPRRIPIPRRVLRMIADYIDFERTISASRSEPALSDPLWLMPVDRKVRDDAGKRVRVDRLTPRERRRVLIGAPATAQHAVLWLTECGQPVPPATWEAAFRRACVRCRRFGIEIDVTPHTLRHTFAGNMLSMLIREQIGSVFDPQDRHGAAYRRILCDPLQKLQHLLGHASVTSTYIYLDSLAEAQELVEAAADRWAEDTAGDAA